MKKLVYLICMLFISRTPSFGELNGLYKVIPATTDSAGMFDYNFGFRGHWTTSSDSINGGQKGECRLIDLTLGVGYVFTNYLSVDLNSRFLSDIMETDIETTGSSAVSYGFGDIHLGLKFTPTKLNTLLFDKIREICDFGVYSMFSLPTGEDRKAPPDQCAVDTVFGEPCRVGEGGLHRFYTAGGVTGGIKLLFTYTTSTQPEIPVHLNLGYIMYPEASVCSKYSYGVGAALKYAPWLPFLELYGEGRVKSSYNDGAVYITPGLGLEMLKNMWLILAIEIRLSPEPPKIDDESEKYHIQGGFGPAPSWAINFTLSQKLELERR